MDFVVVVVVQCGKWVHYVANGWFMYNEKPLTHTAVVCSRVQKIEKTEREKKKRESEKQRK